MPLIATVSLAALIVDALRSSWRHFWERFFFLANGTNENMRQIGKCDNDCCCETIIVCVPFNAMFWSTFRLLHIHFHISFFPARFEEIPQKSPSVFGTTCMPGPAYPPFRNYFAINPSEIISRNDYANFAQSSQKSFFRNILAP